MLHPVILFEIFSLTGEAQQLIKPLHMSTPLRWPILFRKVLQLGCWILLEW